MSEYKYLAINMFGGGLNDKQPTSNIADNEAVTVVDCDLDEPGFLKSRKFKVREHDWGITSPNGIGVCYIDGTKYIIHTDGTNVYANNSNIGSLSASSRIRVLQFKSKIFIFNPTDSKKYNGTNYYNWGITTPTGSVATRNYIVLDDCESEWTDAVADSTKFNTNLATISFQEGTASVKCKMKDTYTATANNFITTTFTTKNLSTYTGIQCWVKCNVQTFKSDIVLKVMESATVTENLLFQNIAPNDWKRQKWLIPQTVDVLNAVTGLRLANLVDTSDHTFWFDDFRAVKASYDLTVIDTCETFWTSAQGANVVCSVNNTDPKEGTNNIILTLGAGATTGLLGYRNLASTIDLSDRNYIGFWIKYNTAVTNDGWLTLVFFKTAGAPPTDEVCRIAIPADLEINTWYWIQLWIPPTRVNMNTINAVGLYMKDDEGALTIELDYIIAYKPTGPNSGDLIDEYHYKTVFENADGVQSNYELFPDNDDGSGIESYNEEITLTVPVSSDSQVTKRKIYRTKQGEELFYLLTTISDNTTTTYTDETLDVDMTEAENTYVKDRPQNFTFAIEHYDRIWGIKLPNQIYPSEASNPEYFDATSYFNIGDEEDVTGIIAAGTEKIIFKKNKIFVMDGTSLDTSYIRESAATRGCVASDSIARYGNVIFLYHDGIYEFNGIKENLISEKIDNLIAGINSDQISNATGFVYNDKYYLSYADSDSSINNKTVIMDFLHNNIVTYDFGFKYSAVDTVAHIAYVLGTDGHLYSLDNETNSDTETVSMQYRSKAYDFGVPNCYKILREVTFHSDTDGEDVTFNVYADGLLAYTITYHTHGVTRVDLPLSVTKGKLFQFEWVYSGTKRVSVQNPISLKFREMSRF